MFKHTRPYTEPSEIPHPVPTHCKYNKKRESKHEFKTFCGKTKFSRIIPDKAVIGIHHSLKNEWLMSCKSFNSKRLSDDRKIQKSAYTNCTCRLMHIFVCESKHKL
jgi:hypothetical protein